MTRWQRLWLIVGGLVVLVALLALRGIFGPPHSAYVGPSASITHLSWPA
ncbi:MAG TPA: hypothetical protein VL026_14925 [Rhizomicrobium sp.]|nr:hypothetical protein [Rhizomicrobium sp.]